MYLATGIILFFVSLLIVAAIIFTTARTVKVNGEILISKFNLLYLAPTLLLIYVLHLTAWIYNGGDIDFFNLFSLIGSALEVITKFSVDTDIVLPICQAYPIFYANFVLAYVAGGATVILSVASFFGQRIRNHFSVTKRMRVGCDIVIGDCSDSAEYLKNNKNSLLLSENLPRQRYGDLLKEGRAVVRGSLTAIGRKLKKGEYNIILFSGGNVPYTKVIDEFVELRDKGYKITLNLQAEQDEVKVIKEKFIAKLTTKNGASINCFSRHELIARHFVADYPLTKFVPRSFYNDNLTVKDGKELNVVFVGFGRMNYQLFRMCSMQFQFATQQDGRLASKLVNYYIYDNRDAALHNEFFSRMLYEFDEDFKDCDFPKPDKICNIEVKLCDINSVEAKKQFKELVTDKSFTYFVISLKTDLEDASYAKTVERLLCGEKNYRIFVRAKGSAEKLNSADDNIIYFGQDEILYRHESIINDDLSMLAQRINILYNDVASSPQWLKEIRTLPPERQNEALIASLKDYDNREEMRKQWEARPMIEQASNLYHALNLSFKLSLLGFNMVKQDAEGEGATEKEFNLRYVNSGRLSNYSDCSYFFETEMANVLAFIEHSRWNALYILNDYRQMKKSDMSVEEKTDKNGNISRTLPHKNIALKQHACLTTYYGLKELVEYKFSVLYPGEDVKSVPTTDSRLRELYNIYVYDYMDLDRLYSEITAMGYKFVDNVSM